MIDVPFNQITGIIYIEVGLVDYYIISQSYT